MKHKFLTLATLAVALFAGTLSASAQKDVTSTYIKNATLSSLDGWTLAGTNVKNYTGFNTPQKGNNTTGYAAESYAGWESLQRTEYSMKQNITLPAGSYRLVNYSFYRQGQAYNTDNTKSLCNLVAGDESVAIKTLGSVTAAGYANSQADGANAFDSKMYRNYVDFTIPEGGKTITIGLEGTHDAAYSWCIAGQFELFDMNEVATASSPTDVTYMITNAGGEYRDMTGWTLSEDGAFGAQSNTAFDNKAGGYYIEKWQANGSLSDRSMSQTLTNLPAGVYTLSAYSYYNGTGAKLFAGDNTTEITAGKSGQYSVKASVEEGGSLNIGFKLENGTSNWVCVDRFTLTYYDPSTLVTAFNEIVAKAEALYDSPMNADVLQALKDATVAPETSASTDEWDAATTKLNNAIAAAETSIAKYEAIATTLATLDDAGKEAFNATEVGQTYVAKTYTDADCTEAFATAAKAQTTEGADMSLALTNYDFLNCTNGNFPGWTISAPNGGNTWKNGTSNVEYWIGTAADGKFDYYQTIEGLKNGKYKASAKMWNSMNSVAGEFAATSGVYVKNGYRAGWGLVDSDCDNGGMVEKTSDEVVVYDGTLRLGVANKETMVARWFGVDWIKLTYVGTASDDEIAAAKAADDAAALAAAKEELAAAIAAAPTVPTEHISDAAFDYNQASVTALSDALAAAQGVCGNASATLEDIKAKIATVKALTAPALNAPASTQAYKIINHNGGDWTYGDNNTTMKDDCAMTAEAGHRSDMGNYDVQYIAQNPNYAQAMYFTQVEGGYNISWTDAEGNTRYLCTGTPYSGNNNQIRTTTTATDAMVITVTRNGDNINLYNVAASQYIGAQDAGVYTVNSHNDFVVEETTAENAISKTVADGKYATVCLPYAVASVSGAYEATVNGSYVTLNAVTALEANKAYILGAGTYNFSGVSVAYAEPTAGTGLNGVFTATAVPVGSYVMQTQSGTQQFYKVEAENQPTLDANKAYLTTSSDAKSLAIGFADEESTGINAINALVNGTAKIYDLNGRQLNSLQKGVNIVNGVKVMVK